MTKLFAAHRIQAFLTLVLLAGFASCAKAEDHFAVVIGAHGHLVIFGPKGERAADIGIPTIATPVTVGTTSFQVSYGLDSNNVPSAVFTPASDNPQDLHFTVLTKTVDATKAVVTLNFPSPNRVIIDPGYVGSVSVNSRRLRSHRLGDMGAYEEEYVPRPRPPAPNNPPPAPKPAAPKPVAAKPAAPKPAPPEPPPETAVAAPAPEKPSPAPGPAPRVTANLAPRALPPPAAATASATPAAAPAKPAKTGAKLLHWAGRITPRHGPPPTVGLTEMKLVEVHGAVTVKTADGKTAPGANGMLVTSGTVVSTSADASAAVFMGGVDSARFLPNSEATVAQELKGSQRNTTIDLTAGTVFCRVGRRAGETQDYQVHTPQGIATAAGTEFAVTLTDSNGKTYTVCFVKESQVTLTDSAAGDKQALTPKSANQVAAGAVPAGLPPLEGAAALVNILTAVQPFNTFNDEDVDAVVDMASSTVTKVSGPPR